MSGVSLQICDDVARITFRAPVSPESTYSLIDNIELALTYYQTPVEIRIHSPGGDAQSLRYFASRISEWRKSGMYIGTVAMAECASAAALMLSLGTLGFRRASYSSRLLYHRPRVEAGPMLTNEIRKFDGILTAETGAAVIRRLERLEASIKREDDHLHGLVSGHISPNDGAPRHWFATERKRRGQLLANNRDSLLAAANRGAVPIDQKDEASLTDVAAALVDPTLSDGDAFEIIQAAFEVVLDADRPSNPFLIWALMLIDHVDGLDLGTPTIGGAQ